MTQALPLNAPRLRRLARRAEMTPAEFLTATLERHATYDEAAEELEVTTKTLRRWRKEYL